MVVSNRNGPGMIVESITFIAIDKCRNWGILEAWKMPSACRLGGVADLPNLESRPFARPLLLTDIPATARFILTLDS